MKALQYTSEYLDQLCSVVKRIRFFATVVGGALIGAGQYFRESTYPFLESISGTLFWVGLVILLISNFLLVFIDKQSVELLKSLHEEEIENEKLRKLVSGYKLKDENLVAWITLNKLNSELIDQALMKPNMDKESRSRIFDSAVEFISERKLRLFGVKDDYLNISIYEYSKLDDCLHCISCYRSRPSDANTPRRSWGVGQGYVGKTFERKRTLICADARVADVASLVAAPPDKSKEDDAEKYVSLIAVPIAVSSDLPLGVIIITSDQPQRFINQSEKGTAPEAHHHTTAVESLEDIASQLAQLMYILNGDERQMLKEAESNDKKGA